MVKERIPWIDMAKGIGITLVIFAHLPIPPLLRQFIYTFHMPLFFFLSGYIFYNGRYSGFRDFLIRKLKSLIVPYFCFSALMYLYWLQDAVRHNSVGTTYHGTLLTPVWGTLYGMREDYWGPHNGTMWFLTCLFVTEILFYLLLLGTEKNKKRVVITLAICSISGYLYSSMVSIPLPLSCDAALTAIVFYGTGYLIREYESKAAEYSFDKLPGYKLLFFLLAINLITGFSQERVDMYGNYYHNYILFYLAAFSGIGSLLIVVRKMKTIAAISFTGKNSIILLALHQFLAARIVYSVYRRIPYLGEFMKQQPLIYGILATIGIIIFCMPAIYAINNYFPFIIGKGSITKL